MQERNKNLVEVKFKKPCAMRVYKYRIFLLKTSKLLYYNDEDPAAPAVPPAPDEKQACKSQGWSKVIKILKHSLYVISVFATF